MNEPSPFRTGGPTLRPIVTVQLPVEHNSVRVPRPTSEYGGLPYCPLGTLVRLDIGAARTGLIPWDADRIAAAVFEAAEVEIVGTDPAGVAQSRAALAAALDRFERRHTG